MLDSKRLAHFISEETGLPFSPSHGVNPDNDRWISFVPDGYERARTFSITLTLKFRRLLIEFVPGAFAADLLRDMSNADEVGKQLFASMVTECARLGASSEIHVNGSVIPILDDIPWDAQWRRFAWIVNKGAVEIGAEDASPDEDIVRPWLSRFSAGVVALLPLEAEANDEQLNPEGLPEGAKSRVEVNRYERDRRNRAAALAIHGYSCLACDMNFEKVYGAVAAGFIEVHHITPVSEIGENYRVNPKTDLIPLCPNCHAVVHRKKPPITVDELRALLNHGGEQ